MLGAVTGGFEKLVQRLSMSPNVDFLQETLTCTLKAPLYAMTGGCKKSQINISPNIFLQESLICKVHTVSAETLTFVFGINNIYINAQMC